VLDIAKGKMRVSFDPSGIDTGESNLRSRVAGKGVAVHNVTDSHLVPISK
jgi:hypothetical protein